MICKIGGKKVGYMRDGDTLDGDMRLLVCGGNIGGHRHGDGP